VQLLLQAHIMGREAISLVECEVQQGDLGLHLLHSYPRVLRILIDIPVVEVSQPLLKEGSHYGFLPSALIPESLPPILASLGSRFLGREWPGGRVGPCCDAR
jgi:hypothetical protein